MVRCLLVVLMLLLPTQFTWAAVATYCEHETTPTSFHIGHHDHQHQADSLDPAQQEADLADKPIFFEHDDCSYCQTGVAQFGAALDSSFVGPQGCAFVGATSKPYNFRVDEDIDRPKWMRTG